MRIYPPLLAAFCTRRLYILFVACKILLFFSVRPLIFFNAVSTGCTQVNQYCVFLSSRCHNSLIELLLRSKSYHLAKTSVTPDDNIPSYRPGSFSLYSTHDLAPASASSAEYWVLLPVNSSAATSPSRIAAATVRDAVPRTRLIL